MIVDIDGVEATLNEILPSPSNNNNIEKDGYHGIILHYSHLAIKDEGSLNSARIAYSSDDHYNFFSERNIIRRNNESENENQDYSNWTNEQKELNSHERQSKSLTLSNDSPYNDKTTKFCTYLAMARSLFHNERHAMQTLSKSSYYDKNLQIPINAESDKPESKDVGFVRYFGLSNLSCPNDDNSNSNSENRDIRKRNNNENDN
ncbi:hypothetical protein H8356DRAFT_1363555 [Neocallimastix lanati (nom. inval.)]|nr:hypothetical protein H8356DRAFT_1363555 [Neocallimastix sp. JGI-2020a]